MHVSNLLYFHRNPITFINTKALWKGLVATNSKHYYSKIIKDQKSQTISLIFQINNKNDSKDVSDDFAYQEIAQGLGLFKSWSLKRRTDYLATLGITIKKNNE